MTHGLCGKEGAMVFKRVLKGIGRLMLTTAVMCGVGLFLCSSEVKAAVDVDLDSDGDGGFKVTVSAPKDEDIKAIKTITLYNNSDALLVKSLGDNETVDTSLGEISKTYTIKDTEFIMGITDAGTKNNWKSLLSSIPATISVNKATVEYATSNSTLTKDSPSVSVSSKKIYEVTVNRNDIGASFKPSFTNKFDGTYVVNERDMPYGYEGEKYTVIPYSSGFDPNSYYNLVRKASVVGDISTDDPNWKQAGHIEGELSSSQDDNNDNNELQVAYLPAIGELKISSPTQGTISATGDRIDVFTTGTTPITSNISYEIVNYLEDSENLDKTAALQKYSFVAEGVKIAGLGYFAATTERQADGICKVDIGLENINQSGSGSVTISAKLGSETVSSVPVTYYIGVKPKTLLLQNVPISLIAGGEKKTVKIFKGVEPSGANQDPSSYEGTLSFDKPALFDGTPTYNPSTGEITIKASSTATAGSAAKVTLTLKDSSLNTVLQSFDVKIISFSKDNTIKSINNSNKNYITYNKDKGYSLDIKQLIIDNAKDTSDNTVTITKDQITNVSVGGSPCTDGIWKPSEAATNKEVKCKVNGVQIDGIRVSAYPMPTATYSSSNRTLSVKIPTKVATAYSDDNNIRQSKGFKLILEDSSGNTLYEYTDSKYQSVLSSSSESTVTYTVPAADIEGMVTSAASNGKFSADTTSVKFKVIPMGYKQSSTSDETIKAKDEIAGKTDAVTVYKVSASGTNFTSSAAYGLDGQTVSITATPNSGYSFKQWSDGNTSNPRQVKVSASGTRSFQAVAGDRVANSTGAGGTDNSELYDDVPKTAESNSAIWLIVFMVFAVMGTTYALYLQLRAANSKHDR